MMRENDYMVYLSAYSSDQTSTQSFGISILYVLNILYVDVCFMC